MATSNIPVDPIRVITPMDGDTFGTANAHLWCGCFGFVSNAIEGKELVLFAPVSLYVDTNRAININNIITCTASIRSASGYVQFDLREYLTTAVLLNRGRGLEFIANNSNWSDIADNTPITGVLELAFTF